MWDQEQALALCTIVESICTPHGCHVALTGGALYKQGKRKDIDILFYKIRQCSEIDLGGLEKSLKKIGVVKIRECRWLWKALYRDKSVDIMFPELEGFEYPGEV